MGDWLLGLAVGAGLTIFFSWPRFREWRARNPNAVPIVSAAGIAFLAVAFFAGLTRERDFLGILVLPEPNFYVPRFPLLAVALAAIATVVVSCIGRIRPWAYWTGLGILLGIVAVSAWFIGHHFGTYASRWLTSRTDLDIRSVVGFLTGVLTVVWSKYIALLPERSDRLPGPVFARRALPEAARHGAQTPDASGLEQAKWRIFALLVLAFVAWASPYLENGLSRMTSVKVGDTEVKFHAAEAIGHRLALDPRERIVADVGNFQIIGNTKGIEGRSDSDIRQLEASAQPAMRSADAAYLVFHRAVVMPLADCVNELTSEGGDMESLRASTRRIAESWNLAAGLGRNPAGQPGTSPMLARITKDKRDRLGDVVDSVKNALHGYYARRLCKQSSVKPAKDAKPVEIACLEYVTQAKLGAKGVGREACIDPKALDSFVFHATLGMLYHFNRNQTNAIAALERVRHEFGGKFVNWHYYLGQLYNEADPIGAATTREFRNFLELSTMYYQAAAKKIIARGLPSASLKDPELTCDKDETPECKDLLRFARATRIGQNALAYAIAKTDGGNFQEARGLAASAVRESRKRGDESSHAEYRAALDTYAYAILVHALDKPQPDRYAIACAVEVFGILREDARQNLRTTLESASSPGFRRELPSAQYQFELANLHFGLASRQVEPGQTCKYDDLVKIKEGTF